MERPPQKRISSRAEGPRQALTALRRLQPGNARGTGRSRSGVDEDDRLTTDEAIKRLLADYGKLLEVATR